MTITTQGYLALLDQLREMLDGHREGHRISLMLQPPGLELGGDQVLVETATSAGCELRPRHVVGAAPTAAPTRPERDAAEVDSAVRLASRLWAKVLEYHGGPFPQPADPIHLKGMFDPGWLRLLHAPVGTDRPASQTVALADHGITMERHSDAAALAGAYQHQPRTRVYEDTDVRAGGPFAFAGMLLSQLARYRTACSFYESIADDATLGEHRDEWYGIITQLHGRKRWDLSNPSGDRASLEMHPGDVLLLPRLVPHDVSTPEHSLHVVYAVLTDVAI